MKILLFACLALISNFLMGQDKEAKSLFSEVEKEWVLDDNGNVSFTKVIEVPGVNKDELYARALSYFTYNYKSSNDVIQVKDKEQGLVIGKGIYGDVYKHEGKRNISSAYDVGHIIRIDLKDNKARLIITIDQCKLRVWAAGVHNDSDFTVLQRFPFAKEVSETHANNMCYTIYNTCERVKGSMAGIEKSLKEGNTGSQIEKSDW